ncbi:SDR family NAD(P)-dependent oxidoreductase [Micromonospora chalcea]|uniref:SDR family NAD(P)-dependent oxidoreductase n=1 Tax=Micromonospora chalcea TaxID=1874 RepID=UPI001CA77CC2|nr:SDR family NAD(P)-dependent oxidoreductase [Micromonospora chalcea]
MAQPQRIVVMTGATAGLGAHALGRIAAVPGTRVLIGARGAGREVPAGVEVLPLDLASLASVRAFADQVCAEIGENLIDVLVLNAGAQSPASEARSADGFELTFAVNHLAHYLLVRLLVPHLAEGGRLVITTSDTHDPAVTPIAPKTLDPLALAHPAKGGLGSGMRAYAASKLCNLLTAQAVAASADVQDRGVSVVAFNPGLTGGTSLGRDSSPVARIVVRALMGAIFRVVGLFKPEYVMSTAERSGEQLAQVALGVVTPPPGRIYVSLVKGEPTFPDPSELARSRDAQQQLWRDSADMVGLAQ